MIYKAICYAVLIFGGSLSGAFCGVFEGPIYIVMSADQLALIGACLGGTFALIGCRLAIERAEAAERNRQLFRALEARLSRVESDSVRRPA
ncbi:hypothetical protein [Aquisphaera giovannonii]|nr:hypothetical protein [Aquisphaera giovannonii]